MKPILRTALLVAAGLLILHRPGMAAPGDYYIGADSRQALEQAQKTDPGNYAVNYFLGQIYLAAGNRDAAITAWNAYLAGAPADGRSTAVRERMTLLKLAQAREFAKTAAAGGGDAPPPPADTIAVTDFKNLGPQKLVPFIKGLTAMIISDLAKVPQVRVLERARIQALMQEMQLGLAAGIIDGNTAPKLGQMVQAAKVAWGKIDAPDGDNLEITSIVTEIMGNTNLKETDAQGAMDQFFELQKKLVFGILEGMGIQKADLPDDVRKAVEKVHTTSVDALIEFGTGVDFLDNKNFAQAKQAFAKAAQIDPAFDLAGEAEIATPISDVPVTSDGATEEVSMSTAGAGETEEEETTASGGEATDDGTSDEGTADSGTTDEGAGDDTVLADTGDTAPSTAETVTTDTTAVTDTTTDTSQTTTTEETETTSGGWGGTGYGIIMVDGWMGTNPKAYVDTYRTTSPQSGSSTGIATTSILNADPATVNGQSETITAMKVNGGTAITGGLPYPMKSSVIGQDSYMEWGRFNVSDPATTPPMQVSSLNHSVDSMGYYVGGGLTDASQMSNLALNMKTASYSGNAYGTLWTPTGGINMTGTLTMDVDFHTGGVSNFVYEVFDGGVSDPNKAYAFISGASGSITGTNYQVNVATGSWGMDRDGSSGSIPFDDNATIPQATRDARGSFFGPDALKTGGIVAMKGSNNGPVNGMFEATRGALTP